MIGILVSNLGTPDAPTPDALKIYLKEFLSDRRVVEVPRLIWWFILNFFILKTRPKKSAVLYQKIWTKAGSPLLIFTNNLAKKLAASFATKEIPVVVGMRYGQPSLTIAMTELKKKGCDKILVFPLYPQYASATTASTFDGVNAVFKNDRMLPELRLIRDYHNAPEYIAALTTRLQSFLDARETQNQPRPEKILFSFHGIPKKYGDEGDPYFYQCHQTARLIAKAVDLKSEEWLVSFQSRFGKEEWLQPYTDVTLVELAKKGIQHVAVICPGFAVDCLETLEEIAHENKNIFLKNGGSSYEYIPALNDSDDHAQALYHIAQKALVGWVS